MESPRYASGGLGPHEWLMITVARAACFVRIGVKTTRGADSEYAGSF